MMSIGLRTRHTLDDILHDIEREEIEQRPRHVQQPEGQIAWVVGVGCILLYAAIHCVADLITRMM